MSLNTKFCSILPPFGRNFNVKLWPEFDPPLVCGFAQAYKGQKWHQTKSCTVLSQCTSQTDRQTDIVLVAISKSLSKSVWFTAKDMSTLVLGLDFRHTSMSI